MISKPPSLIGDVILFSPNKKHSGITLAQTALRRKRVRHKHVAIAVSQGNAIHAMPFTGVQFEGIRKLLLDAEGEFSVFRNKKVEVDMNSLFHLNENLLFHIRQRYNFLIFWKPRYDASFCSELAAKAYKGIGIDLSKRKPSKTLPFDIYENISSHDDWFSVTDIYQEFFLGNQDHGGHDLAAEFVRKLEYMNQEMAFGQQTLAEKIKKIGDGNGGAIPPIEPFRKYWSNDFTRFSNLRIFPYYIFRFFKNIWRR